MAFPSLFLLQVMESFCDYNHLGRAAAATMAVAAGAGGQQLSNHCLLFVILQLLLYGLLRWELLLHIQLYLQELSFRDVNRIVS